MLRSVRQVCFLLVKRFKQTSVFFVHWESSFQLHLGTEVMRLSVCGVLSGLDFAAPSLGAMPFDQDPLAPSVFNLPLTKFNGILQVELCMAFFRLDNVITPNPLKSLNF